MKYKIRKLRLSDANKILASIKSIYGQRTIVNLADVKERIGRALKMKDTTWVLGEDCNGSCVCVASIYERCEMCFNVTARLLSRSKLSVALATAIDDFVEMKIAPVNKVCKAAPFVGYVVLSASPEFYF